MIGVFDSGFGGLSALPVLQKSLPNADILYFGDTKNAPYGEKSNERLVALAENALSLLRMRGCTSFFCACGTLSAVALPRLPFDLPLNGVLLPAVKEVRGKRVAVLATCATVQSHAYLAALSERGHTVYELACPDFVPLIEGGAKSEEIRACVRRTLAPLRDFSPDILLLGCTHYPFLSEAIHAVFSGVPILSAAASGAKAFVRSHPEENKGRGKLRLLTSGDPLAFSEGAARLSGIHAPVEQVDIH